MPNVKLGLFDSRVQSWKLEFPLQLCDDIVKYRKGYVPTIEALIKERKDNE